VQESNLIFSLILKLTCQSYSGYSITTVVVAYNIEDQCILRSKLPAKVFNQSIEADHIQVVYDRVMALDILVKCGIAILAT
jgi:hypothetical protein